jgi:TatD DNase family protein
MKEDNSKWMDNTSYLVDSHCHIKYLQEQGFSAEQIMKESFDSGVKILNNICADLDEMEEILQISKKYEQVFCTVGQHPENVSSKIASVDFLLKMSEHKKVIAFGESGLDYHYTLDTKTRQIENFMAHIEASRQAKIPLVIHSRECDEDMIDILQREIKKGKFDFVLHCFCSGEKLAEIGLSLGGFISFSGILTFKNSTELQSLAKKVPKNKILVETDAPFLAPVPFRGSVNKPSYVVKTAEFLASLLDMSFEEVQNMTTGNFFDLFRKARPGA